ncbi:MULTISPECIES: two-component system response regulator [Paraburkholderia]|uniref:Sensor histidine kinase TmoS n=1 Tax=Paraburkholderia nemoris TaxID=2793076 RepID=A0ABM8T168_9BURK|nr:MULTISPECIES: response regulator [Paraburkholderia]KPD14826.1 histidine kinase [Burkholderia sp. ST111]MBK5152792.1 response regulator [Burkholderia sp. R-69608]MBK5184359.1 response regulator [Burkholderia sp. R-69749]MBK3744680.1 response regulator [Paraburkholderia aspalathi]MBK3815790.1 response regulator [Paraburkholderia aspalathi]
MASVLLVDDDAETLAAWEANCIADGFQVKAASDGKSALAMFIESPVDIVVADWRMPVMSGSELCHRLRTLPGLADVTFILVSGEPSPPAFISYDGFLRKPVDGQILLTTMRRLLTEHTTHREQRRGGTT